MDDDGDDQGGDERAHDEPVDRLPGRQREHVEPDVVVEDRVACAEGHAVHGALEQQPVRRGAGPDDDRDHGRDDETAAAQRLDLTLVDVLDDVDALEGTMARRQAARYLDVAPEDGKEDGAGRHADDEPRPDLAPEDDAQAYLAEPQPVGVGQQVDDEQHQGERGRGHDDADEPTATMGCRRPRLLGRHLVDLGHGSIIADCAPEQRRMASWTRGRCREGASAALGGAAREGRQPRSAALPPSGSQRLASSPRKARKRLTMRGS